MRVLSVVFVVVLAISLTSCARQRAARQIDHPTTADSAVVDSAFPPTMGELSFESGGSKLNGLMDVANGPGPHPTGALPANWWTVRRSGASLPVRSIWQPDPYYWSRAGVMK